MACKYKAFSLIELMVVIAIIGVLSAIAIPSYKAYVIRAKILEGVTIASMVNNAISQYHSINGGEFPNAAQLAERLNTTATGQVITFNLTNVASIDVASPTATSLYYGLSYTFDVGGSGRRNIYIAVKNISGILTFKCGIWNITSPSATHIKDPQYLPSGCNETNIMTFYNS